MFNIDHIALTIDEIPGQAAYIVNPSTFFSLSPVEQRYVLLSLSLLIIPVMTRAFFIFICFLQKVKFEDSKITDFHEFVFESEKEMVAVPLFTAPRKTVINLTKQRVKIKPLKVLELVLKTKRENKAAFFDVGFLSFSRQCWVDEYSRKNAAFCCEDSGVSRGASGQPSEPPASTGVLGQR